VQSLLFLHSILASFSNPLSIVFSNLQLLVYLDTIVHVSKVYDVV
jgi:hypothetical protein